MKLNRSALVYTGLVAIAIAAVSFIAMKNPAPAAGRNFAAVAELREGDMRKLNFHATPKPVSQKVFITEDGTEATLAMFEGKLTLLNFWATWCAPCRHEMPMLAQLQDGLGDDSFQVVTLATGRNMVPAMKKFFAEIGVENLPLHRDPKQDVARDMAVLGLPATVLIDKNGQEIARLQGDADWSSENARAIIRAVLETSTD